MSLLLFYGSAAFMGAPKLTGDTANSFVLVGFGTAFAEMSFGITGVRIRTDDFGSANIADEWWSEGATTGIGNSYQIQATLSSGTTPTGPAMTTWHNLSTARAWSHSRSVAGTLTCVLSVSIRDTATSTVRATASYTITAIAEN